MANRGVRIAEIRPLDQERPIDTLLRKVERLPTGDTGMMDGLLEAKRLEVASYER